jgi:pimeloyl-ACP methyl ester carboxylesterase
MEAGVRTVRSPDGTELRGEIAGNVGAAGPPVVLLHGSVATRSSFKRLRPWLADEHRLILTVLRGHEGPELTLPPDYGMATTEVDDLVAVLDGLGEERVLVVGHSTGGTIAVSLALRQPERIARLVLIEPTLLALLDEPVAGRARADLGAVIDDGRRGAHPVALRRLLELMGASRWAGLAEADRQRTLDALAPLALLTTPHVQALVDFQISAEDVRALRPPTLLIYGAESVYFEAHIAARLRQLRPDFRQLHVEGAGHNVHAERADVVGPAVADFLRSAVEPGGAGP